MGIGALGGATYVSMACLKSTSNEVCRWVGGACCWCFCVFPIIIAFWAVSFATFFAVGVPLAYISFIYFCGRKVCCMWNPCIGCCKRKRRKNKSIPKRIEQEDSDDSDLENGLMERSRSEVLIEEPNPDWTGRDQLRRLTIIEEMTNDDGTIIESGRE